MRKKLVLALLPVTLAALAGAPGSIAGEKRAEGETRVTLSAAPKVATKAGGEATFRLDKEGKVLFYTLAVKEIENATMGHIHAVGFGGTPGAIIAWLYPASGAGLALKEGTFSGTLAEGEITAEKLAGAFKGKSPEVLAEMIVHGKAGVAVHTKQNPLGEIWGFIKVADKKTKKGRAREPRTRTGY